MEFQVTELLDREVVVELFDGERVCGIFTATQTDGFICLRAGQGNPYLLNERYIKMLFLKPEDNSDDTE